MTNEIDLIRRLVNDLARSLFTEKPHMHERGREPWPFDLDGKERCHCSYCDGRQYLEWREPPKVEDPASDQLDLEEAIAKAKP